jgi:hypothetical protein
VVDVAGCHGVLAALGRRAQESLLPFAAQKEPADSADQRPLTEKPL